MLDRVSRLSIAGREEVSRDSAFGQRSRPKLIGGQVRAQEGPKRPS
jgi:hypothetical protein